MLVSLVVAMAENTRAIGFNNQLLWHLPEDLKLFKKITMGHHMIMGRKTYESIGKPLPGRTSVVVTRDTKTSEIPNLFYVESIARALDIARKNGESEAMICGGGEIYKQALPFVNKIYLSLVPYTGEADTFFPEINMNEWRVEESIEHPGFIHQVLVRI
jgi:dihydrofolate reductase